MSQRDIAELIKNLYDVEISPELVSKISEKIMLEVTKCLEKELHTVVYFAEPHNPWQLGTNEDTNDMLRFFFPKDFDFRSITQDDVDFVVDLLNNRPRKCLEWKTPAEIFFHKSVAFA